MTDIRPKVGSRWAWLFALPFAVVLPLALPGCQGPLGHRDEPVAGTGTLSLSIGLERARTILPMGPAEDFENVRLEFTCEAGTPLSHTMEYWDGVTDIPGIPEGIWKLTVHAYLGGYRVATGKTPDVRIAADGAGQATVTLTPLSGGTGVFRWDIGLPTEVDLDMAHTSLEIRNWPLGAGAGQIAGVPDLKVYDGRIADSHTLDTGVYLVVFTLATYDRKVELTAILHILRNMESVFTHDELEEGDFGPGGTLLGFIVDAWNNPAVEFAAAVYPVHFEIIGVRGVTEVNFPQLIDQFTVSLGTDTFPEDVAEICELVDAAIVAIYTAAASFGFITHGLTRTQVEAQIRARITGCYGNETEPSFAWSQNPDYPGSTEVGKGDTLVVTVGDYMLPLITFLVHRPDVTATVPHIRSFVILPPVFSDQAPQTVRGGNFSILGTPGQIVVDNSGGYFESIRWFLGARELLESVSPDETTLTMNAYVHGNQPMLESYITVVVEVDRGGTSVPYSVRVAFGVTL